MVRNLKRGIVDLASVVWTCLFAGKDTEFGREVVTEEGKTIFVNSGDYAYENSVNHLVKAMDDLGLVPRRMVFVVEGKNGKAVRRGLLESYGGKRDKSPEHYESFTIARDKLIAQFRALGSSFVTQDNVEGDDVIAYVAQNLSGYRYIISGDKDLAAQVGPGPRDRLLIRGGGHDTTKGRGIDDSAWDGYIHHYRQGMLDQNPFGPFEHRWINAAIALIGDTVDGIPGARGFGKTSFENLLVAFGDEGLGELDKLIRTRKLARLAEDVAELKSLQKIIDGADAVYTSYELARPWVERVNTKDQPLHWTAGMVMPRTPDTDERLRQFAGQVSIVSAENYAATLPWLKRQILASPDVSLDVETSTPAESDAWLERLGKTEDRTPVDVFGSELSSLQLTFGPNGQYTAYFPINNVEVDGCHNITVDQLLAVLEIIPKERVTWVHNASFELPVCYNTWGEKWSADPDWHGFLPNVMDTRIASSYVDENESAGLKKLSSRLLGYQQMDYATVTTKEILKADWNGEGKLLAEFHQQVPTGQHHPGDACEWEMVDVFDNEGNPVFDGDGNQLKERGQPTAWAQGDEIFEDGPEMVRVQFKMDQLTAAEVLNYGADDTICTLALADYFTLIMEIENTWSVFCEVEQLPAYVTALAFVQGVDFSLQEMREMEKEDEATYDKNWAVLRQYLIDIGFDGTTPPVWTQLDAAAIKEAFKIVTGSELKTLVRTPDKLVKLIQQKCDEGEFDDSAANFAVVVDSVLKGGTSYETFNAFVASKFDGEPKIDLNSPKQMTALLYDHMKLPVRIVNKATDTEKAKQPDLDMALRRFQKLRAGSENIWLEPQELALIRKKAKADDTAIESALAFDGEHLDEQKRAALKAISAMKTVLTRQSLFYKPYWGMPHWKDGKVHASVNQCGTVTRRYSASNPNVTQLPKLGEGVKFRKNFKPHHRRAVVCSADFSGQELRIAAERSQDKNLLSCYVGDNLKDVHSITAAGAMTIKWGAETVQRLFETYGAGLNPSSEEDQYTLFSTLRNLGKKAPEGKLADDLRKVAKNVNFGSIYLARAPKLADTLIMTLEDATVFLDARNARFPGLNAAAERAEAECSNLGYSLTLMGARRHLRSHITSFDSQVAARAARQAWNFEVQASAAEMTKLGMARLWRSGVLWRLDMKFWFPVHDELVWSVDAADAAESLRVVHDCMVAPYATMAVPILSSLSLGPSYGEQIEVGDWFIEGRVLEALKEVTEKYAEAA